MVCPHCGTSVLAAAFWTVAHFPAPPRTTKVPCPGTCVAFAAVLCGHILGQGTSLQRVVNSMAIYAERKSGCMRCVIAVMLLFSCYTLAVAKGGHGTHSSSRSSKSHGTKSKASKATHNRSGGYTGYRRGRLAQGYTLHSTVQRDSHGRIKRSRAARDSFMRQHPCPSTGRTSGRCPGYVVDHVRALVCGEADAPSNMQWQTTAAGKAKDRTERYCR